MKKETREKSMKILVFVIIIAMIIGLMPAVFFRD